MGTQISIAKTAAAIVGLLIALALSRDVAAQPAELKGLSSAAPRNVLNEMSPVFERMTGRKLVVEYAFSPDLKRRIEAGDPFDVAILPPDIADDLMGRYKLVAGSRVDLGRTGLGVAVRKGASPPDVSTADRLRAAFLAAPTVAYADGGQSGVQFHAILARLGIAEAMKPKLRPYPSGSAVEAVARGDADLVVIGVSTIRSVPAVTLVGWLPPELQNYIVFTASIGAAARQPQAAQTLLNLLTSPTGIARFKAQGFEPMEPSAADLRLDRHKRCHP
jgi:molybdate transport system substrate-binding protein